jgi:putative flavoprotein involved in K+ transport
MQETVRFSEGAAWLADLERALNARDVPRALSLFVEDCYWRDFLSLTWNIKTMEGKPAIAAMLEATLDGAAPVGWTIEKTVQTKGGTEAWFTFTTRAGKAEGIFRLEGAKCRTILTTLQSLSGFEEPIGLTRPLGTTHRASRSRQNWSEKLAAEQETLGANAQPYCLIIGGGQGGIMLGARLRQLDVPTIIAEKNERPGDSWRNRYRSLVLHDPVWYDHFPYLSFPDNWPIFAPKDKMGDWLESYVRIMELNYWNSTEVDSARFDPARKCWTVDLTRQGRSVTIHPTHVVFATGAYGPPNWLDLPGANVFRGELLHSSGYRDGSRYAGKNCVVIGAASSGHDVALDLWEAGANVTMVQRTPTTVVRSDTLMEMAFDLYSEQAAADGIDVDTADMIAMSTPFALLPPLQRSLYEKIRARDADFYDRLRATGFLLDFGPDETGLMMKAYRTGSGYYIDVGCSQLIIDNEIKVKSGVDIERLTERGLRFVDGTELDADVVIQATGFHSMHETIAQIVSREVGDRIGRCWGLGSGTRNDPGPWQGELRNMYKPIAHENLWLHGGNLALSRYFSKFVALQIKARMEGIETPVYGAPT